MRLLKIPTLQTGRQMMYNSNRMPHCRVWTMRTPDLYSQMALHSLERDWQGDKRRSRLWFKSLIQYIATFLNLLGK